MNEAFLHYVWKYQYFDKTNLITTKGEKVEIYQQGYHNTDAGPDFKEAKITINQIEWCGHVEIHYKSSDWTVHGHQNDKGYNNTILHVVWQNNKPIYREDGTTIPTIELKDRIDLQLIEKYEHLIKNIDTIPCANQLERINAITKLAMVDRVVLERLERKAIEIREINMTNGNDWEETTFQLLARNFGFKINSEPFFILAQSLSYKILRKHADNLMQVEALLFGQAGFLEEALTGEYFLKLRKEYHFLQKKYNLQNKLSIAQWNFLRLRPANFPTTRIAEFAAFISNTSAMFSSFLKEDIKLNIKKIRSDVSPYWQSHYKFGASTSRKLNGLGLSSARNICINTIAPLLTAYSKTIDDQRYLDIAVEYLQVIPAEQNKIVDAMKSVGFESKNAFDSQGLIELCNNYCHKRKCLQCSIGVNLMRT